MTITPDDSKHPSDQKLQRDDLDEPPPSYSMEPTASGSASPMIAPIPTPKTKPTNFLALSTKDSTIRGEFAIDPSIRIPPSMLPPLSEGESEDDRKNLSLTSKHGSIHVEIWLFGPPSSGESTTSGDKPRRTKIVLTAGDESIRAQVHTLDGTAPFLLTAHARESIRLSLPRSFQGLLSLTAREDISLSDILVQNGTQLSQIGKTRRYFIGDFQLLRDGEWQGDQVDIETRHGSIRLKYVDEVAEGTKKGFFGRLLGK